jgi:hypothetical protein
LRAWMTEQGRLRARLWTTEANGLEWERAYVRAIDTRNRHRIPTAESAPVVSKLVSANGDGNRAIVNVRTSKLL